MRINKLRVAFVAVVSFAVTLAALLQIPRLADYETCVSAAFIITGAYAWFGVVLWANLIHPLLMRDKRRCN